MDQFELAANLNRDHLMHIAQVLGLFPMKMSEIKDFEGGTYFDKMYLIDYQFGDAFVQVKGMHQGFNTFTLPYPHLRRLQELMDEDKPYPEFHVEMQFDAKGEIRAIGATSTALLCEIFSGQHRKIPFTKRDNAENPGRSFYVLEWEHFYPTGKMSVIWYSKAPQWMKSRKSRGVDMDL